MAATGSGSKVYKTKNNSKWCRLMRRVRWTFFLLLSQYRCLQYYATLAFTSVLFLTHAISVQASTNKRPVYVVTFSFWSSVAIVQFPISTLVDIWTREMGNRVFNCQHWARNRERDGERERESRRETETGGGGGGSNLYMYTCLHFGALQTKWNPIIQFHRVSWHDGGLSTFSTFPSLFFWFCYALPVWQVFPSNPLGQVHRKAAFDSL